MEYRNPVFNLDNSIDCEINHPQYGWIPFTASSHDPEEYGKLLHEEILKNGNIQPCPPIDEELLKKRIRFERDILLKQSDWSQLSDVPENIKNNWAEYRQALRDVPQQKNFPHDVTWPTPPNT